MKGKNLPTTVLAIAATKANIDEALAASWVASLNSTHSRRNCERTAQRFLAALAAPLRQETVEHMRGALTNSTAGLAPTSARQIVLRVECNVYVRVEHDRITCVEDANGRFNFAKLGSIYVIIS